MMKKMNKAAVGLFVAALSVAALAVQDGVNLKRAPKVGETTKYRLKGNVDMQGTDIPMSMLVTEKVTKVEDNGNYTVESAQSEGKVTTDSGEMDIPGSTISTIFKTTGEVVEVKTGETETSSAMRLANLQAFVVQDKAVKVGDTWSVEIKKDEKSGAAAAKGTYKIEAQEKVGDYDCYKVTMSMKETEGDAPAGLDGTAWINVKDGGVVKMEGAWKNAPFPGVGPLNVKFSMTREG